MRDDYEYDYGYYEYEPHERQPYQVQRIYMLGRPPPMYDIKPPRGDKFKFSKTEIEHLFVAYIVLVISFAVAFSTGGLLFASIYISYIISFIIFLFPMALIAVGLGFILHEVAHKFAAQHYGCWSEFRYDKRGLMMGLIFSVLFGIVWAAPGATWFSGRVTRKENGIISLAGPSINMVIAAIFIPLTFIIPLYSIGWYYVTIIGFIVAYLAVFNLLPIQPLDGSHVWQWNKGVYVMALSTAVAIAVFFAIAYYTTLIFG